MQVVAGGLWLAGLLAWSFAGIGASIPFFIIGAVCAWASWNKLKKAEQKAERWRTAYPTYKY